MFPNGRLQSLQRTCLHSHQELTTAQSDSENVFSFLRANKYYDNAINSFSCTAEFVVYLQHGI